MVSFLASFEVVEIIFFFLALVEVASLSSSRLRLCADGEETGEERAAAAWAAAAAACEAAACAFSFSLLSLLRSFFSSS